MKLNISVLQAALIMQVLQLTDAQIANLPTDQRQSILILKEQIAKSAQGRDWISISDNCLYI